MGVFLLPLISTAALSANAASCPAAPASLKNIMVQHIVEIRANEYCEARVFKASEGLSILIYTAEGACGKEKIETPGTCSTNWVIYMVGEHQDVPIGPVVVGGKGFYEEKQVSIFNGVVKITGLTYGRSDPLCCPTIPAVKFFKVSDGRFVQVKP